MIKKKDKTSRLIGRLKKDIQNYLFLQNDIRV